MNAATMSKRKNSRFLFTTKVMNEEVMAFNLPSKICFRIASFFSDLMIGLLNILSNEGTAAAVALIVNMSAYTTSKTLRSMARSINDFAYLPDTLTSDMLV
jgi:hypothetical protein